MRRDVQKVISERPKSGRTWESKTPRRKQVVLDTLGDQIDERSNYTRREHQKHRKTRYNVVERFLIHRVGRAWNKVYAELCKVADSRSLSGVEIRDYVKACVATQCWLNGRSVMSNDWRGCPSVVRGLYVHPKSGMLLRNDTTAKS